MVGGLFCFFFLYVVSTKWHQEDQIMQNKQQTAKMLDKHREEQF